MRSSLELGNEYRIEKAESFIKQIFFLFFFFNCCTHSIWKFPNQGWNPSSSRDLQLWQCRILNPLHHSRSSRKWKLKWDFFSPTVTKAKKTAIRCWEDVKYIYFLTQYFHFLGLYSTLMYLCRDICTLRICIRALVEVKWHWTWPKRLVEEWFMAQPYCETLRSHKENE